MERCIYFFIIGAFSGWVLEFVFKIFSNNLANTPGILFGPFCILYGIGTVVLSLIIPKLTSNSVWQFILSFVILTVLEYITFVLLKNIYGVVLWDYSSMPLKFDEKICVEFSTIWGILGVLYIRYVLPLFEKIYNLQGEAGFAIKLTIWLIVIYISIDFLISSYLLLNVKYGIT